VRLGFRDALHHANAGQEPIEFGHAWDLDLGDKVPKTIRRVHGRKAGVLSESGDRALHVPAFQCDHHDATDPIRGVGIFGPTLGECGAER